MAAASEILQGMGADEDIIKELVALQEVPVMAKLQSLLRSIFSRLATQGSKIEKAEEQGRIAALLKDEFEHLSKSALDELKAEKEADKNNWLKLIEDKLRGIDDIAKQYGDVVAALQGADLSILQSLPSRLTAIEEKTPGLHDSKDGDHFSLVNDPTTVHDSADVEKSSDLPTDQSKLPFGERLQTLQEDFDDQNDKIGRLEEQIKELKTTMQDAARAYSSDIESLQKICRNLRSDLEMLPILDISAPQESVQGPVSVNPDYTGALSEIQARLQRKADNDTVAQLIRSTTQAKEGLEKMKLVVDELKQQVRTTIPPASRRSSSTNIQAPPIEANMTESSSQKDLEVDPKVISEIIVEEKVKTSMDGELLNNRLRSLEEGIVGLATQMAGKADRKDLNGLQIQMSLLKDSRSSELPSSLATFSPEGILMETSPGEEIKEVSQKQSFLNEHKHAEPPEQITKEEKDQTIAEQASQHEEPKPNLVSSSEFQKLKATFFTLQFSLQKLQELIALKADRDELLQLHESMYRQKSECPISQLPYQLPPPPLSQPPLNGGGSFDNEMYKTLTIELDNMNNKMKKLEERSDLNVLITKRLENFTQPAATVAESSQGLNEVKAAINEHADRMMEYADTLLQMEALLASKADASGLQALRQSILELKKRSKENTLMIQPPSLESCPQFVQPSQYITAAEKVEKHEMMLSKLLKDMELLGTGILTLSGHSYGDSQDNQTPQKSHGEEEVKDPHLESSAIASPLTEKHEIHALVAGGSTGDALINPQALAQDKEHADKPVDNASNQAFTRLDARTEVANKHDTILELEEALQENLIKPKGDAEIVNKLAEDFLPLSLKLKELNDTLRDLQDNTAEKDDLQKMKTYLKQRLDRAETAMFSGKGLPGFKCMSCAHRLEKLNPNRADFVPTNAMRRQVLPMHTAERLYHKDGEADSPRAQEMTSPTCENQSKFFPTNSKQLLSPTPLEPQGGQSPPRPRPAKKK
ncbi:hypothetical protein GOP47_0010657 [Adiantum capillus-veneris]|uniref:Uncharacterized protein n=1 Tax=Adiantum capillus-veneris TaxID=13818 RepID=A0A9D4ZIY0_ADICA|nr:hypothetical protein GOP47_0010657 [Adiantum capillus-veneris]